MMAVNESTKGLKYKKPKSKVYFNYCSQLVYAFFFNNNKKYSIINYFFRVEKAAVIFLC
jgi:hypothetical protein